MSSQQYPHDVARQIKKGRTLQERIDDPYKERLKLSEPTSCPDCGAVYHQGRWHWGASVANSKPHRCPACARIHDKVPAGFLILSGQYIKTHEEEILRHIKNLEQKEKTQHPLERIMSIDSTPQGITINYTGIHLAQGTGKTLQEAHQGELKIEYSDKSGQIRVTWFRE